MFDREALRSLLTIGVLIGVGGLVLAVIEPAGSAEQVVSVCSAAIGAALIGVVLLVVRFQHLRGD